MKQFWGLWRNDYQLNLRERSQMSLKSSKKLANSIPQVGDIVLIKENLPRGRWRVGVLMISMTTKKYMYKKEMQNKYLMIVPELLEQTSSEASTFHGKEENERMAKPY